MKYILRILVLPFAWTIWTIYYSKEWVKDGGKLTFNIPQTDDYISPSDFYSKMNELNNNLNKINERKYR
jgi:hypothetical protein